MGRARKIKGSLTMTATNNPSVKKSDPAPKRPGAAGTKDSLTKAATAAVKARKAKNDYTPSMNTNMPQGAKRFTGSGK